MKEAQPKTTHLKEYEVPPFLIEETELRVELDEEQTHVKTSLKMKRNPDAKKGKLPLVLDGGELDLKEISIDGRLLLSNEYSLDDEHLTLFDVPQQFVLETSVAIKPQENTSLEGLYKSGDMFCTQCEAEGFRNITYYLDRPDVMSRYRTTIVADKSLYPVLLSNGNDVARGESEGGKHWVTWEDPFKKPAYLFALVAGDLQHIEDEFTTCSGRSITLKIYTEPANANKLDHAMTSLKNAMAWDEQVYGREYDLDIFMIVAVESFNMGAMENKGLNIFNTSCVLARADTTTDRGYQRVEGVVAHEYFHNWSGNRVTCRDWFQLSLKEGFTVFRDQRFSADMGSATVCRLEDVAFLRSAQFPEDAGPMAHPIRPDSYIEINNFYTTTVYEKGAEVVRMIHTLLGPERFRQGTDLYFDRHDGQAVTTDDFVTAMEDANGVDLRQFRNWYSQAGTPLLNVSSEYDEDAQSYTLKVIQSCQATPGQEHKEPFHLPFSVGLLDSAGKDFALNTEDAHVSSMSQDGTHCSAVLNLTESEQQFTFTDVEARPVPSLLRNFSAPVKLEYDYSRDELMFLMSYDSDGFNRWEAGQRLAVDVIQEVVGQIQSAQPVSVDGRLIKACQAIVDQSIDHHQDGKIDKAMIAAMLVMPGEAYLAELSAVADVEAIHSAREQVRLAIATDLKGSLLSVYKLNLSDKPYEPTGVDIAQRALKNVCLAYLMLPEKSEMVNLCQSQFDNSNNMTDVDAALRALVNAADEKALEPKEKALTEFYNKWVHEPLVLDQWFSIQAVCPLPGTLEKVTALLGHEAYDTKVPNRVRALVAAFASQNTINFHHSSGDGYRFLADQVIRMDPSNPLLAARILGPLSRWRKYDEARQRLMRGELERILSVDDLSKDVYEIASKSV
ncbi:MAG: aminopeptidase N [Pseudomonadales bacterium]|jgi:aminopeptidase N|nr:aminopeptidase N [Pseudomonadales bacterium]HJN51448.1 aminopeptidase N [Pseudomonadales bacterium]|tara:strand:+ start:9087 stop:11780 length:2694 start_codon:yes stop_codon:yes gene_type:complete